MNNIEDKTYMLVIKRDNKDYLPLEWNLFNNYNKENLNTLEGIDIFTTKTTKIDLLKEAISKNILSLDEKFRDFAIIYNEKGKTRELKEGPIFKEDKDVLNPNNIITFISVNIDNKEFINTIITLLKDNKKEIEEFKYILKNINTFASRGNNAIVAALSTYNNLSYYDKRYLSIQIYNRYIKNRNN